MSTVLPDVLRGEPRTIVAGDTASWYRSLAEYPAPTWSLGYNLRGQQPNMAFDIAETPGSTYPHFISVPPAVTATWTPGLYRFQAHVTNTTTGDRITVGWGDITVAPNLAANQAQVDPRSFNRQTRDILRMALQGRLPQGMEHYAIGGRSISKIPIRELNLLLREYQGYVDQEEGKTGRRNRTVRFGYVGGVRPLGGPSW